ncbi:hypothetical protein QBC37DRAFT_377775 [Rhypophila decipiens]|uniref:Pyrrolo-quinoline quinone repeat domain-containing protein n=1 Tax=Rhypophila decipiens TaxID=261697 RepID=A0AAN7B6A3_9PEZI|nr:hypothetical protein QBC37DRAFT_377775 [Rhypophila decipiens]
MLNQRWKTKIPESQYKDRRPSPYRDFNRVTPLITEHGIFAGGYGCLCRLDRNTGEILTSVPLPVAKGTSEAPIVVIRRATSSLLIASSHGRVLGLDPITLTQRWITKLPRSKSYPSTPLLCHAPSIDSTDVRIYAAPPGFVFRLDPQTGRTLARNDVCGCGYKPVSLGIGHSKEEVLARIKRNLYALDPFTPRTRWQNRLDDPNSYKGLNPAVLMNISTAYKGTLYHVSGINGAKLDKFCLKMKEDTIMVLDAPNKRVYIGIDGYAICVSTEGEKLKNLWNVSLPSSGHSVTQVALGPNNGRVYFANNGYVFALEIGGNIVSANALSGFGGKMTNLHASSDMIVVGIDGHCIALETGNGGSNEARGAIHAPLPSYWETKKEKP